MECREGILVGVPCGDEEPLGVGVARRCVRVAAGGEVEGEREEMSVGVPASLPLALPLAVAAAGPRESEGRAVGMGVAVAPLAPAPPTPMPGEKLPWLLPTGLPLPCAVALGQKEGSVVVEKDCDPLPLADAVGAPVALAGAGVAVAPPAAPPLALALACPPVLLGVAVGAWGVPVAPKMVSVGAKVTLPVGGAVPVPPPGVGVGGGGAEAVSVPPPAPK